MGYFRGRGREVQAGIRLRRPNERRVDYEVDQEALQEKSESGWRASSVCLCGATADDGLRDAIQLEREESQRAVGFAGVQGCGSKI